MYCITLESYTVHVHVQLYCTQLSTLIVSSLARHYRNQDISANACGNACCECNKAVQVRSASQGEGLEAWMFDFHAKGKGGRIKKGQAKKNRARKACDAEWVADARLRAVHPSVRGHQREQRYIGDLRVHRNGVRTL